MLTAASRLAASRQARAVPGSLVATQPARRLTRRAALRIDPHFQPALELNKETLHFRLGSKGDLRARLI